MTQEEKQLLLKDLCARLPYGVKCNVWYGPKSPALNEKDKYTDDILETINPKKGNCTFHNAIGYDFGFFPVEHVKPYLRPMSSMTEEEREEWADLFMQPIYELEQYTDEKDAQDIAPILYGKSHSLSTDWLNKKMFDYHGLIEKGLAIEAPEGMYN